MNKVPLGDKSEAVHVWCHVYTQQHNDAVEYLVSSELLFGRFTTLLSEIPIPLSPF
jgi:hypothetical protein